MKDYNEMAKSVFERRDEYLAEQKKKRAMFVKACVPVCSLVLVATVSLILWQAKMPDIPVKHLQSDVSEYEHTTANQNGTDVYGTTDNLYGQSGDGATESVKPSVQNNQQSASTGSMKSPAIVQTKPVKPTGDNPDVPTGTVSNSRPDIPLSTQPSANATSPDVLPTLPPGNTSGTDSGGQVIPPTDNDVDNSGEASTPMMPPGATSGGSEGPSQGPAFNNTQTYDFSAGQQVTYTIELEAAEKFESIQFSLCYDSNYLQLVTLQNNTNNGFADIVPNLSKAHITCGNNTVKIVASNAYKYDFTSKKILLTVDFVVKKSGTVKLSLDVEELTIKTSDMYTETGKYYFVNGEQQIFDGIEFCHKLKVNKK